jgi:hypothetical protein
MKPQCKTSTSWCPALAYAIGFIATDGNLSSDGRHITLVSKDEEILEQIKKSLNLFGTVGKKSRKNGGEKIYSYIHISDRNFYIFLLSLGLTPKKSKTIGKIKVPLKYFSHFLRGCIDGDGSITTSRHPESVHIQLKLRLCSASPKFLDWIHQEVTHLLKIDGGWIYTAKDRSVYTLTYGKVDSIKILKFLYNDLSEPHLKRKYLIARPFLREKIGT